MKTFDPARRRMLLSGAAAVAAAPFAPALWARAERLASVSGQTAPVASPYGPLRPARDLATGLELLQLPEGFSYRSFSWTGDLMSDGRPTPARHDGMAVIGERDGELVLVRNHENGLGEPIHAAGRYDPVTIELDGERRQLAGGTTNLRFRRDGREWRGAEGSLGGTLVNCAGGPTPWGTWLSCEETLEDLSGQGGRRHGYVFEVTADPAATSGEPIVGMGRFRHEAVAVDPASGIVYLTEDSRNLSGFYRYQPNDRSGAPGSLAKGGRLQAARVKGRPAADLLAPGLGETVELEWVDITDPDADPAESAIEHASGKASGPFLQAREVGALRMSRGEGIWHAAGKLAIVDTSAGIDAGGRPGRGEGAVWLLDLASMKMQAIFVSANPLAGDNPDNVTFSPRGGILLCEDGAGGQDEYGLGSRLLGLSEAGEAYRFAKNNIQLSESQLTAAGKRVAPGDYRGSEFCGACFDAEGEVLFVNAQNPGITFAIWGPWARGNL